VNLLVPKLPRVPRSLEVRAVRGRDAIRDGFAGHLADESRLVGGDVECLYLPASTLEVSAALRECRQRGWRVLISGGRTGVVGGAVARGVDAVISLERMQRVLRRLKTRLRVEAGLSVGAVTEAAAAAGRFYPVDPTETTASLGGNIATNASGAHSFHYGSTRRWVQALSVVLADGSLLQLRRGQVQAEGRSFRLRRLDGREAAFAYPEHRYPVAKNTAGYQLREGMDAVDLFIGAEGTLGVVTEAEIKLAPNPRQRLFLVIWASAEAQVLELAACLRRARGLRPLAIEYFDPKSIELLQRRREREGRRSSVPPIDPHARAALFLDLVYRDEAALERTTSRLDRLLQKVGLSIEQTWSGLEARDLTRMKQLRHALPETVNAIISERKRENPGVHKLSTDLAVPDGRLEEMLAIYRRQLSAAAIEHVIFGHIGDNHLHCNMLPRDEGEMQRAKRLYDALAVEAVRLGGTIAAEHGIGRMKRHLMSLQYPAPLIAAMWRLKRLFDPDGRLNPGVLLPD